MQVLHASVLACAISTATNRWGDLTYALGGWPNERKDGPLDLWVPHTTMVSSTINFTIATGRLEDRSNEGGEEESDEDVNSADEDEAAQIA